MNLNNLQSIIFIKSIFKKIVTKQQNNQQIRMIELQLQQLMQWMQRQLDKKYSQKLQTIKSLFIMFYNLSNQIILLYYTVREKMEKHSQKQQYKQLQLLLNQSIIILSKIIQTTPNSIDYSFCQKFIKNFDLNLNILCTYYHSLHHINLINEQAKSEKQKIVQGINKLYTIENKIKQIFRTNTTVSRILSMINDNKKLISTKIQTIKRKVKQTKEKQLFLQNFQPMIVEFYQQYLQQSKQIQPKQQYKKTALKMYFQLKHQLYSTQLALQNLCKLPLQICEQTKQKKKSHSNLLQQSCNTFSRWLSTLLKPNYSMKNFKKIKVQQMTKCIHLIIKQYPHTNNYIMQVTEKNLQEITNLSNLIIQIVKQLQKIQHSGVMTSISEYKQGLVLDKSKKYIHKIIDYQTAMAKYYQLQEEIKKLKNLAQAVILQEVGVKVDIVIDGEGGE